MTEPFAIKTGDPRFDPREPVTVNGFLYVRADDLYSAWLAAAGDEIELPANILVEAMIVTWLRERQNLVGVWDGRAIADAIERRAYLPATIEVI